MKILKTIFVLSFYVQCNILLISGAGVLGAIETVTDAVIDVANGVENTMPFTTNLFHISKQILIGLPQMAVLKTFHELCSVFKAAETIEPRVTPDIESMALVLHKPCVVSSFPLTKPALILESADFEIKKKMVIFVTGWMADPNEDYVLDMAAAFNCRGNYNFFVLDTSEYINTLYTWSAYNTAEIGRVLAITLQKLVKNVPVKDIHLVGHSLGAHIAGYAGRYFNRYTGLNITRITGLDPANPCFNEGYVLSGLQRGDADFIDIIHTNPGVLGKADPMGDVDFYPEGLAPLKPGCIILGCSHGRAYEYFTESVYPRNERNFLAVRCTSMMDLNVGFCDGLKFPMGFAVPYNLKGNYFLSVNAEKLYGKNSPNQDIVQYSCGRCKNTEIY